VVIAATSAPTEGSRIAVVARRRDPNAAEPGVKGRVAPGDTSCRAHAEEDSHGSTFLSTRVAFATVCLGRRPFGPTGMPRTVRSDEMYQGSAADHPLRGVSGGGALSRSSMAGSGYMRCTGSACLQTGSRKSMRRMRRLPQNGGSRCQGRAAAVGWDKRPSPGRASTGKTRR
jgi:hypothetical protein